MFTLSQCKIFTISQCSPSKSSLQMWVIRGPHRLGDDISKLILGTSIWCFHDSKQDLLSKKIKQQSNNERSERSERRWRTLHWEGFRFEKMNHWIEPLVRLQWLYWVAMVANACIMANFEADLTECENDLETYYSFLHGHRDSCWTIGEDFNLIVVANLESRLICERSVRNVNLEWDSPLEAQWV